MQIEGETVKALALERLPLVFDGGGESHRHVCELGQMPASIARQNSRSQGDLKRALASLTGKNSFYGPSNQELSGESVPPIGFR